MDSLEKLSNIDLIKSYSKIIEILKDRGIIRTKNITGELGENYAIEYYSSTPRLPKLQLAPTSTRNIDAISTSGERYSIKTISGNNRLTGVFYGLNNPESNQEDAQKFEYLLIVILNDNFGLEKILEITWNQFLKYKKWHSRMQAWNVSVTKSLLEEANIVFEGQL